MVIQLAAIELSDEFRKNNSITLDTHISLSGIDSVIRKYRIYDIKKLISLLYSSYFTWTIEIFLVLLSEMLLLA